MCVFVVFMVFVVFVVFMVFMVFVVFVVLVVHGLHHTAEGRKVLNNQQSTNQLGSKGGGEEW